MKLCPSCGQYFCESSDKTLWTCFFEHVRAGTCKKEILREPLERIEKAFGSQEHRELENFIRRDSDGLGNPLPSEVCVNLGLAVAYANNRIPEYNPDVLIERDVYRSSRRVRLQRSRRAAKKLGAQAVAIRSPERTRLARHRNSTIHIVSGALAVRHWTGRWHYREQVEILSLMGLSKSEDFIRDRVDHLRTSNPGTFEQIGLWAKGIKKLPRLV
jgi:hypothetical protein